MPKKKSLIIAVLCLFCLLMVIGNLWYWQDFWTTKGFALRQETPDWADWQKKLKPETDVKSLYSPDTPAESKPGLLLRYTQNEGGQLLLKHSIGEGVYSFDPLTFETKRTVEDLWRTAKGVVSICEDQRWSRQQIFNIDNTNYKLTSADNITKVYNTHGNYALDAVISPSNKKAAIISASGPKRPFLNIGWVGLGGGDIKIYGQRYVQIMDLAGFSYADKPVRLYADTNVPCFSACWSSDEKILVAYSCDFSNFQIVQPFQNSKK